MATLYRRCASVNLLRYLLRYGATITDLKARRKVSVVFPLRSDMLSCTEAVKLAQMADPWEPHRARQDQQIAFVRGVEHVYEAGVNLSATEDG